MLQGSQVSRIERDSHSFRSLITHSRHTSYFSRWKKTLGYLMCRSAQTWPGRAALTMKATSTSTRIPWSSAVRCRSANQKKNGLHNSQSEKKRIFCICCIWVRFNPATNENKASWNCAWLIFRKFRSPEETTGAPSISLLQRVSRLLF